MAALTGLLGDYGSDEEDERQHAEPAEGNDMADAEAAGSRPLSALPINTEDGPELVEAMEVEELEPASLEEPSELRLPPDLAEPPDQPCSDKTMEKVVRLLGVIKQGINVSTELRNSRSCRNPDFLSHTVKHFDLDPHGTCYPADIFDPNALHKEDYHDRLMAEFQEWRDRKTQQQSQRVEFVKGGTEKAPAGPGGLQAKAQVAAMQAKAQAVVAAAQHKGSRNKWDTGPGR